MATVICDTRIVDAGGWIPLPTDHWQKLPDRRAHVDWNGDHYEVRPE